MPQDLFKGFSLFLEILLIIPRGGMLALLFTFPKSFPEQSRGEKSKKSLEYALSLQSFLRVPSWPS